VKFSSHEKKNTYTVLWKESLNSDGQQCR